jgi:hypothetical protein
VAVRSFLMSFLARQKLVKPDFATRYGGAWLIWEPGDWKVPKDAAAPTEVVKKRATAPREGDALCFHLELADSHRRTLTGGRDEGCDVVLNDATVSRTHLQLTSSSEGWSVDTLVNDAGKAVRLDGQTLQLGTAMRLTSGARLELGGVKLTFVYASDLEQRVSALAK